MDIARSIPMWLLPVVGIVGVLVIKSSASARQFIIGNPHRLGLPPGPSLWHVMKGILFTMDPYQPWLLFTEWNKRYGHLTYFDIGQRMLIIDSEHIARELLDKRSAKYSGRPEFPTMSLYGWGFTTIALHYNDKWRQHRRFYQHGFRLEALLNWRPFQLRHAHTLLLNLLSSPGQAADHFATFTASTVMAATYGYATLPRDDPLLDIVNRTMAIFAQSTTMFNLIFFSTFRFLEYLPTWLPGLSFYRDAPVSRKNVRKMLDAPFEFVEKSMADGSAEPSLVSEFLARMSEGEGNRLFDQEILKEVAASAFSAGVESTSSVLVAFLLAMTMHPRVQERAHSEIDAVVGRGRLPNFDDRASLPYVEAVLRETLRWFSSVPAGKYMRVAHATTEDDVYNGFFIPKKTIVMVNVWAIAHDESRYQDPHIFNPSRFLTPEGKLTDDNMYYVFGFGRRICPGRHLAEAAMWIAATSILAAFQIRKAKNECGEDIEIIPQFTRGQLVRPAPFMYEITPRSDVELEKLVRIKD
ncbi:hypothetical protein M422DRAFT_259359 [Sphaerobolus stellatus SS14]|uniref:Cytochrome P450 n=1 Tax=Sphaerobolus stellatus (strain SS14) TaxID=990650 RepID=A0A0C9UT00_SPHS4|nr:hypothetical protein M422DRAFT_259359 [Sphaerobolus stellatus SS14]